MFFSNEQRMDKFNRNKLDAKTIDVYFIIEKQILIIIINLLKNSTNKYWKTL